MTSAQTVLRGAGPSETPQRDASAATRARPCVTAFAADSATMAPTPTTIHIRDSKYRDTSPRLAVAPAAWTTFVTYASR